MNSIETAFKEWSVAVDALAKGETAVLLRKGGIKEADGRFSAQAERAILFPTFEHQNPALLKPQYQGLVKPVEAGWHPEAIALKAWAKIEHIFLTTDEVKVSALSDFHIWNAQLAQERLKWKPNQPLYVMVLRVYSLLEPVDVPWQAGYGGCRSWISLNRALSADEAKPAMSDADYEATVSAIQTLLA